MVTDAEGNFVVGTPFEWELSNNPRVRDSGTVMWTFDNVQPGVYHVFVDARTDRFLGRSEAETPTTTRMRLWRTVR
jgi:hypothetical protein